MIETQLEFCLQKGRDAWKAFDSLLIPRNELDRLIAMPYEEFRQKDASHEYVRQALFRVVAYLDSKAADLNLLNEYPDKHCAAQAGIYQNAWVRNLLLYKRDGKFHVDTIKRLVNYLHNPTGIMPIISPAHKESIYEYYIGDDYSDETFDSRIIDQFKDKFDCANPENLTALIAHYIYQHRSDWEGNPVILGLLVHETGDDWKEEFLRDIGDGLGCLWWHRLPGSSSNQRQIMAQLDMLVNSEDYDGFDFYYVRNNYAYYRAHVIDFAVSKSYAQKSAEWAQRSPLWFQADIKGHNDGSHTAQIVFLVDKFEKLDEPIELSRFKFYRKMAYNYRSGMAAFTSVVSQHDIIQTKMLKKISVLAENFKNIILQGAPGTGKTFVAKRLAVYLADGTCDENSVNARYSKLSDEGRISFVTFHQSFDYEDFIQGIRPRVENGVVTYEIKDGAFKIIADKAAADSEKTYVMVIDEINRGNVSRTFGELITLIEKDKRMGSDNPQSLKLSYTPDRLFSVPKNLIIIGTMNTTDRSTGVLDYALRRRFAFHTLKADAEVVKTANSGAVADRAMKLFAAVSDLVSRNKAIDTDYDDIMVGHSYFIAKSLDELDLKIRHEVIPLIEEYIKDGLLKPDTDLKAFVNAYMQ